MPEFKHVDAVVNRVGSVATLTLLSAAAREWVEEHCETEAWQWMGVQLAVEPRMVDAICEGMFDAGLQVTRPHAFRVGDFAESVESGWIGRIVEEVEPGFLKLLGVDPTLLLVCGGSADYATCEDDPQWFYAADLRPVARRS